MGHSKRLHITLWVLQVLLAIFFGVASGSPKFFFTSEEMGLPITIPTAFLMLIGVAEILGGLGLILPGIIGIRPGLTAWAAAGLATIAACAVVYQLAGGQPGNALFAAGMAAVTGFVAYAPGGSHR